MSRRNWLSLTRLGGCENDVRNEHGLIFFFPTCLRKTGKFIVKSSLGLPQGQPLGYEIQDKLIGKDKIYILDISTDMFWF